MMIVELMRDIRKRASDVVRNEVEQLANAGSKALNAELPVQKNRADLGRGHQVLQVAIGIAAVMLREEKCDHVCSY